MKIAVVLIHNKTQVENEAQISLIANLVEEATELLDGVDDLGNVVPNAFTRYFYRIKQLAIPHEVEFYHIIPYQPENTSSPYKAVLPFNLNLLKGRTVQYGRGDEDKLGEHPRFFNWSLKRGTDYGADIVLYIDQPINFSRNEIRNALQALKGNTGLTEYTWGKLSTKRLIKEAGQLDETKPLSQGLAELKQKAQQKGLE